MSGKLFFFMYMLLIGCLFISLKFIFHLPPSVSFSHVDEILFVWVAYISINGWYHHIPLTNRFLEFGGLIHYDPSQTIMYHNLKQTQNISVSGQLNLYN